MIYEYECKKCGTIHERVFKMSDFPKTVKCECGGQAKKILSIGAIHADTDVPWLPSASEVLVKHHEKPLTTRTEYRQYLKENHLAPIG